MSIFKKIILILCVISILNFGCVVAYSAEEIDDFMGMGDAKVVKVVFIGDSNSGRTACLNRLVNLPFDFYNKFPTVHSSCVTKQIVCKDPKTNAPIRLDIDYWDTSGNKALRAQVLDLRARDADFVIITINLEDVCKEGDLWRLRLHINNWINAIKEINPRSNIILLGTYLDIVKQMIEYGEITQEHFKKVQDLFCDMAQGISKYTEMRAKALFVSAMSGENFDQIEKLIYQTIVENNLLDSLKTRNKSIVSYASEHDDESYTPPKKSSCYIL